MSKPRAPAPPDPKETAAASTGTNVATALANASLNNVNQVGPDGSKTYSQSGTYKFTDPYTGHSYDIPNYTQTTTLSPQQQALYDLNNQTEQNLGRIGVDQSAKIGGLLGTNVNLTNDAVEGRLNELGSKRLDPQFARDEDALRTRMANQGLQPGSAAWNAEMERFGQNKNDARNQLLLTGRQQSIQEILTERNQPLNEIIGLMNGSQVQQPQFGGTPQNTIPTTDVAGLINTNYQQRQQAAQQEAQQQNALMGGLFGLAGAGVMKYSDRRLKKNIKKIGKTDDGQNLYRYEYKGSDVPEIGLMAQEAVKKKPDAVKVMPSGFMAVDYDKALGLMDA